MVEIAVTLGIILFTWLMVTNLPDTNRPKETEREVHERIQKEKELRESKGKEHEQETEEDDGANEEEGEMIYASKKGKK
jgi:hypothetical protein